MYILTEKTFRFKTLARFRTVHFSASPKLFCMKTGNTGKNTA